ncbi:MAG TPA: T9SS type A sorting domain-containing protein [Ignavibacteria bacterium]|nr:T9SS type A sorting domain-containing protein [Ignavibacteria bacterium]
MRFLIILLFCSLLPKAIFPQSNWNEILNLETTVNITGIHFLNNDTGWVCADANSHIKVLKTYDNGKNWDTSLIQSSYTPEDIYFININTGFIACNSGKIYKTTNGGDDWFLSSCIECGTEDDFLQVIFINENTGFAPGGSLYKTVDAGNNWYKIPEVPNALFGFFHPLYNDWLFSYNSYKSTDNGSNWINSVTIPPLTQGWFINNTSGWAIGGHSSTQHIYKTINGGESWTLIKSPQIQYAKLQSISSDTVWVASENKILRTYNSGVNWTLFEFPYFGYYHSDFQFVSGKTGWVASKNKLFYTDNGGSVSINLISNEIPSQYHLSQNYPNPFNPITKIQYQIPKSGFVSIKVYDINGKEIVTLVNENHQAGTFEAIFDGSNSASGIYFYRIQAGDFVETKKMMLTK